MHGAPTRGLELVSWWLQRFQAGETDALEWSLTRPFTFEDPCTDEIADRRRFVRYAGVLAQAVPGWSFEPSRTEVHAHRVEIRARIDGQHTGTLDLGCLGGPCYPATGRGFRLPEQSFVWEIVHGRIHRFEVHDGPGIGPEAILAKLGLTAEHARGPEDGEAASEQGSNASVTNGTPTTRGRRLAERIEGAIAKHRRRRRRERIWRS